jgi:hypothetical protein
MDLKGIPVRPVTITLEVEEILVISSVFATFTKIMNTIEMPVPKPMQDTMGEVLEKIIDNVAEQVLAHVLKEAGKN